VDIPQTTTIMNTTKTLGEIVTGTYAMDGYTLLGFHDYKGRLYYQLDVDLHDYIDSARTSLVHTKDLDTRHACLDMILAAGQKWIRDNTKMIDDYARSEETPQVFEPFPPEPCEEFGIVMNRLLDSLRENCKSDIVW
jgi:hypothetical protein